MVLRGENVMADGHEQRLDDGAIVIDYHTRKNDGNDMNHHCVDFAVVDVLPHEAMVKTVVKTGDVVENGVGGGRNDDGDDTD